MTTLNNLMFENNDVFYKTLKNIDLETLMCNFENINVDDESVSIAKELMKDVDTDTIKSMIAETKNDAKLIESGKPKEYFVTSNITNGSSLFKFMVLQKRFTKFKTDKERKRAWEFSTSQEELEKYGFYNENDFKKGGKYQNMKTPKQTDKQIAEWTELSTAKINGNKFENQFDLAVLILALK